ncbi:hypothetical protein ACFL2D_01545 [Patescibacteria group bacterium]
MQELEKEKSNVKIIVIAAILGILGGGIVAGAITYVWSNSQIDDQDTKIEELQEQIDALEAADAAIEDMVEEVDVDDDVDDESELPVSTSTTQTHTDTQLGYTIEYPIGWSKEIAAGLADTQSQVVLSGPEGEVQVDYEIGRGGGSCENFGDEPVDITTMSGRATFCYSVRDNKTEHWSTGVNFDDPNARGLIKNDIPVAVTGSANVPANDNRETILDILESFKFTD